MVCKVHLNLIANLALPGENQEKKNTNKINTATTFRYTLKMNMQSYLLIFCPHKECQITATQVKVVFSHLESTFCGSFIFNYFSQKDAYSLSCP